MVLCGPAFYALARLTITDGTGAVLADVLVKPPREVTDHLTRWSGITAESLAGATATFEEARLTFLRLVRAHHVLVGHSLENDLKALKVRHPRIMDTGLLFPHPRGGTYRSSLKYLAQKHLSADVGASFQQGEGGHDSVQDARVALHLARLKLSRGPDFGAVTDRPQESVLDIVARAQHAPRMIAPGGTLRRYAGPTVHAIPAYNDEDAADKAIKELCAPVAPVPGAAPGTPGHDSPVRVVMAYLPGPLALVEAEAAAVAAAADAEAGVQPGAAGSASAGVIASVSHVYGVKTAGARAQPAADSGVAAGGDSNAADASPSVVAADPFMSASTLGELPAVPAEPTAEGAMRAADALIGRIWDAAPRNTLVAFVSGQHCVLRERVLSKRAVALRRIPGVPAGEIERSEAEVKAKIYEKNQGLLFINIK
jgi:hypothetical protein